MKLTDKLLKMYFQLQRCQTPFSTIKVLLHARNLGLFFHVAAPLDRIAAKQAFLPVRGGANIAS